MDDNVFDQEFYEATKCSPCPFCGTDIYLEIIRETSHESYGKWWGDEDYDEEDIVVWSWCVVCKDCEARGPTEKEEMSLLDLNDSGVERQRIMRAVSYWNNRVLGHKES